MQIIDITDVEDSQDKNAEDISSRIAVGIDFGTTNSLVAISRDHSAQIIKADTNVISSDILPSIVSYDREIHVGYIAQNSIFVRSIKRLFAKSYDEIKENKVLSNLTNSLVCLDNKLPGIKIEDTIKTVPEVASEIFKSLKKSAENDLGYEIKKAVVSVPAYFNDLERGQVIYSAKLAGLDVIRLIAEPTAAAYAYGLNGASEGSYMVYDLGGGTFDISILDIREGVLQVIGVGGDNNLGGDDIDYAIALYVAQRDKIEVSQGLIESSKFLKESFSDEDQDHVSINNDDLKTNLSRSEFQNIINPILKRTLKIAKDTLFDAEIDKLDGIILVGGSTRIPDIRILLQNEFGVEIFSNVDPDRIVALGAAMQAENLTSSNMNKKSLLLDVLPLSVGIELYGGIAEKIILRNTSIPFSIKKEFTTHSDNQSGMQFHVLQGEREMAKDCRSLARFELSGLQKAKAGRVKVVLSFAIDADGILSVTAEDPMGHKQVGINISPSFGLDESIINMSLEDAYKNAKIDHETRLITETRLEATELIYSLEQAISETPDILDQNEMKSIENTINSLQKLINGDNRDDILIQMQKLNSLASKFIEKHLNLGANKILQGKNIDQI